MSAAGMPCGSSQRQHRPDTGARARRKPRGRKALILGKVVLVTGVARQLGGRFVRRIQRDPDVDRVIGVDAVAPEHHLGDAEFVRADIRQPAIAKVLAEHSVDTVVHMDVSGTPLGARRPRRTVKETNVIGTMQLLGACQKAPDGAAAGGQVHAPASTAPRRATRRSSPRPRPPKSLPSGGFAKDAVEVEGYVRGFARRRPDVAVCVLRFANILGPRADSPLAEYFVAARAADGLRLRPAAAVRPRGRRHRRCCGSPPPSRAAARSTAARSTSPATGCCCCRRRARRLGRPTVPVLLPAVTWVGHGAALRRHHGLLAGADPAAHARQGGARPRQMRETLGFTPDVHDGGDLRGLRPQPRTRAAAARARWRAPSTGSRRRCRGRRRTTATP